jgi:Zn-dependent protease
MRSIKLGSAFGIGIYVHPTFLLLFLWVVFFSGKESTGFVYYLFTAALLIGVFTCVVLHELGHALMARQFGIGTRDITLYPIGGVARLERMPEKSWDEFWIAVAGPAVNVVIAVLLAIGLVTVAVVHGMPRSLESPIPFNFVLYLAAMNVSLVVFNLIPAFPMDGGRVLRALLAINLGYLRATEIAAKMGAVLALMVGVLGILNANPWPAFIGLFVFLVGQQELAMVRLRDRHHAETQRAYAVDPSFSGFIWDDEAHAWVLWRLGRPIHVYHLDTE